MMNRVCLRSTATSALKQRLSQTNTRSPAPNPALTLLSVLLRRPMLIDTPAASWIRMSRSSVEKNRCPSWDTA